MTFWYLWILIYSACFKDVFCWKICPGSAPKHNVHLPFNSILSSNVRNCEKSDFICSFLFYFLVECYNNRFWELLWSAFVDETIIHSHNIFVNFVTPIGELPKVSLSTFFLYLFIWFSYCLSHVFHLFLRFVGNSSKISVCTWIPLGTIWAHTKH